MTAPSYLITGDDASLISEALTKLLVELCGDNFVPVEEHGSDISDDQIDIAPVLDAMATPPFLADRRVVVLRAANKLDSAQATQVAERVKNPVDGNILVLVVSALGTAKAVPQAITRAIKANGGAVLDTSAGQGRQRSDWVFSRIRQSAVRLDAEASKALSDHLGEEVARLAPILDMLEAAYGEGSKVSLEELLPFLGDTGSVPPWDLTDALDRGDGDAAVKALHRMMDAGGKHPLQIMSTLHRHYGGMLRLDGASLQSGEEAASILKMSPFPAKKVLEQGRRLGHDRIVRAVELLADSDANLRGLLGWPGALVMEVLVARLAQLARSNSSPATPPRRSGTGGTAPGARASARPEARPARTTT